jgi:hypothetical protein
MSLQEDIPTKKEADESTQIISTTMHEPEEKSDIQRNPQPKDD